MGRRTLRTKLCDILDIEYPILSAGMGPSLVGETTGAPVELVVAVSEAGGLGVLGAAGFTVDELREQIREIKKSTDKPFGVDLLLPSQIVSAGDQEPKGPSEIPLSEVIKSLPKTHYDWIMKIKDEMNLPDIEAKIKTGSTTSRPHASIKVCIEEGVPLFCAGLGNPGFMVKDAHAAGMKVLGISGNTKNARRIAQGGADLVVAQGHEGGGHTGRIGSIALWPQAVDATAPTPLLAAGGIGDGRGLAAALAVGCVGVWVGTRFLATVEGGALPIQKETILQATDEDTRRSYLYTGKTSRAIYNQLHELWDHSGLEPLPFPTQVMFASAMAEMFNRAQEKDYMGPFSGQVSGLIDEIKPAAQVVEDMVEEAVDILTRRLPESVIAK
ncbi:MAG: nitronate monooxygenase [Deltaproteobacteria bacterium]|nr:nitronate monooxygenase [Deltaproteobacteria bacterium]MBW2051890.1 nitronate monooxygenase [Deltaproteobacteria bacterium]MBW2141174.1 nitronate monooxygenase [Deltaproteobacteria bacterium]MBW2322502.1 nitronate monooxygenase [Deltaproteobacteria bacterium]